MKLKTYTFLLACCVYGSTYAQQIAIQPAPQQVKTTGKSIALTGTYRMTGLGSADAAAVEKLNALLKPQQHKKGFRLFIGEKNDKEMKKFAHLVPDRPEAYYLSIDEDGLVLVGSDERGTYYGVQTLSQLLQNNRLPEIEITDFPDIAARGVVEGFYGTPWSFEDRVRQLKFYGENKLNTYFYGPKDDPYHSSPNWRLAYPEKEAQQLRELVRIARENKVDFVWAIHPGQDIKWTSEDRQALIDKFEKMYQLGVRSFAVFFDDISGEGTDPAKQAELLNYIDDNFVKIKKDVTPLVMCPTEYNKSWSNPEKGYLTTLGDQLNPSIRIMWTGDRVISDMSKEGLTWINQRIKRPAYVWWNFPVSDYVRDHLLMGPVYGNAQDIKEDMSGFVSNPMERAEASKIAIYSVANYAWNLADYDSRQTWERAIRTIMPHASDALLTFASHNSDLGKNGHGYRRDESVEIQPVVQQFVQVYKQGGYDAASAQTLQKEFAKIEKSSDALLASTDNKALIEEIKPWIYQFKLLGETGNHVLAMLAAYEKKDTTLFLQQYDQVKSLQEKSFVVDQTYNQNPYQPGVKTGSLVLQPFVNTAFALATARFNQTYGRDLSAQSHYCPHKLTSDVPQLKDLPLQVKNNQVSISPMLEVVKWKAGQSVAIELDAVYPAIELEMNLGVKDVAAWGNVQITTDGSVWLPVDLVQNNQTVKVALGKQPVKAVRFTNASDKEQEAYMRRFTLTIVK